MAMRPKLDDAITIPCETELKKDLLLLKNEYDVQHLEWLRKILRVKIRERLEEERAKVKAC